MIEDLSEDDILDLAAQFDDVSPTDSVVVDVGVIQSLVKMAKIAKMIKATLEDE